MVMIIYKCWKIIKWKLKIIKLKILFGSKIDLKWSDRIAESVIFRINGNGKIILGENVELRENIILNVSDGGVIQIKDRVFVNDGCCINSRNKIVIDEDCLLGQGIKMYDHDHDYRSNDIKINFLTSPITIKNNVWICSNVIVLKGVLIGAQSVIAAGTVLRCNVPNNRLFYTKMEEYGEKIIEKG